MKSLKNSLLFTAAISSLALTGCLSGNPVAGSEDPAYLRLEGSAATPDTGSSAVGKVTLCHIPPGNPANAHAISVGAPAVKAHLDHGDVLGACPETVPPDGSGDPEGGSNPEGGST